jgi:nudix-type nucleoside diphosphatase (YffH/AdpP family)
MADDAGETFQREVVSSGRSACVLPYDPARRVALIIRLPRAPVIWSGVTTALIEAPAGMIEEGESAETTIRREAMEEVGLVLRELEPVAVVWPSPGVLAERSHLFLAPYAAADRQGPGGGLAEEHEGIVAEELALARLWDLAEAGGLQDMKTLTLVLALRTRHPDLF